MDMLLRVGNRFHPRFLMLQIFLRLLMKILGMFTQGAYLVPVALPHSRFVLNKIVNPVVGQKWEAQGLAEPVFFRHSQVCKYPVLQDMRGGMPKWMRQASFMCMCNHI